jgi:streptomycin 6-kinase
MGLPSTAFEPWLTRWSLTPDGAPFRTDPAGALMLPVRRGAVAAMLKVAPHPEEKRGGAVMAYYAGGGAAAVLAHDDEAVVLERLDGPRSLAAMARGGEDEAACRILCDTAARLHAPRAGPLPAVIIPLDQWFADLWPRAAAAGGFFAEAAAIARELLAGSAPAVVLHGDIHHGNVLDGAERGWRAIDPKGLLGPRGYDYANMICNPDAATARRHFDRRVSLVSELSAQAPGEVLRWLVAYTALSASWTLGSGGDPWPALDTGALALAALKP